jgi:pimeloyl-ACP methyl ester carboxylesterase
MVSRIQYTSVILVTCVIGALLFSCGPDDSFFYIHNNGADFPVWIKGNTASNTIIVFLHGGPGNTSFVYSFESLEKRYAVVYWDQRQSGSTKGNPPESTLTIESFIDDVDRVIDIIRERFRPQYLYLMGHSWGGTLAAAYCIDTVHQRKLSGWITIDGAHDLPRMMSLSREWVIDYATRQIESPSSSDKEKRFWREACAWYDEGHFMGLCGKNFSHHARYVSEAGGYWYNADADRVDWGQALFFSPVNIAAYAINACLKLDVDNLDLTSSMRAITIPTCILWGEHDGIAPVGCAMALDQSLALPENKKQLVVFSSSGAQSDVRTTGHFHHCGRDIYFFAPHPLGLTQE